MTEPVHERADGSDRGLSEFPIFGVFAIIMTIGTSLLLGAAGLGSFGFVFLFGVPLTIGFVAGFHRDEGRALGCATQCALVPGLTATVLMLDAAGLMCTVIAGLYLLPAMVVGMGLGRFWRRRSERRTLRVSGAAFLLVTAGLVVEPLLTPAHQPETVTTSAVLPLGRNEAWNAIVFYEDVAAPPPVLCRIGLPRPIGVEGQHASVGAIVRCLYETGSIEKLVTELRRGERLAFDVIHQEGVEDRSVELLSGSFTFTPEPGGGTRVTLETTYRPKLQARVAWRPFERAVCHDLHRHVLHGLELRAAVQDVESAPSPSPE